jgi:hypothetical protein
VGTRYTGGGYHTNIVSDAILFKELGEGNTIDLSHWPV